MALYFTILASFLVAVGGEGAQGEMMVGIVDSIIVVAWCLVSWRLILPLLAIPRRPFIWLLAPVIMGSGTFLLASAAVGLLGRLIGIPQVFYGDDFLNAGYGWGTVVLFVCVQPAVIEELAFRGVILGALSRVLSTGEAVVVSALMFMVIHLAVPSFPHLLVLGLVLGWLRVRTGSLWPCMILHFTHNFLCIADEAGWISTGL